MPKPKNSVPEDEALRARIRAVLFRIVNVLGSQAAAGAACGKTQGHFSHWLKAGMVPAEHCPALEGATRQKGRVVFCEEMRPDVPWANVREWPLAWHAHESGCAHG